MTEILLGQFCIFLTNERCDWFSLSISALSMDLGSNLFYLVSEFLFSVTGDSFESQLVPQTTLSTVLLYRVGYFCCPFFYFQTPHCSQKCKFAHFSQGQHDKMSMNTNLAKEVLQYGGYIIPHFSKSMFKRIFFLSPLLLL